ncbi:hypothetical protein D0962_06815 [Leptolyngbyaceae cyanobacterium CCMR0082]|uniref:Uncharacterized protein n=1 Tax=Adonisia turfae CCMR0082 TaxID=2304604 RepID=A0A6M0S1Z9_9CYAN|nr:hypothetical protein [Adonisia turfae]NEZ62495.1 hypothetical protein [Adonisia turfae CCMR0082]
MQLLYPATFSQLSEVIRNASPMEVVNWMRRELSMVIENFQQFTPNLETYARIVQDFRTK